MQMHLEIHIIASDVELENQARTATRERCLKDEETFSSQHLYSVP
jgi:hypothetical protein